MFSLALWFPVLWREFHGMDLKISFFMRRVSFLLRGDIFFWRNSRNSLPNRIGRIGKDFQTKRQALLAKWVLSKFRMKPRRAQTFQISDFCLKRTHFHTFWWVLSLSKRFRAHFGTFLMAFSAPTTLKSSLKFSKIRDLKRLAERKGKWWNWPGRWRSWEFRMINWLMILIGRITAFPPMKVERQKVWIQRFFISFEIRAIYQRLENGLESFIPVRKIEVDKLKAELRDNNQKSREHQYASEKEILVATESCFLLTTSRSSLGASILRV